MRLDGVTAAEFPREINIVSGGVIICSACSSSLTRVAKVCPVCGTGLDASRLEIVPSHGGGWAASTRRGPFHWWRWTKQNREGRLHKA
jgi:hypothetical protein